MTRTRSQSTQNTLAPSQMVQDQYNSVTGAFVRTTVFSYPAYGPNANLAGHSNTMTDEESFVKKYGYCLHERTTTKLFRHEFTRQTVNPPDLYIEKWYGDSLLYVRFRTLTNTWLTVPVTISAVNWNQMSYEALKSMRPKFSDLSIANDLLELGQIRSLLKPGNYRKGQRNKRVNPTRSAANLQLWYQFGIKPAVETLKGVLELLKTLPESIRRLREQHGKTQTRHYSRRMDIATLPSGLTQVYSDVTFKVNRELLWKSYPKYTASLRYVTDVSSLTDFELSMRAWLQASGLDNPVAVLWNAIPLSFVVDWFVGVNEWVESMFGSDLIPIKVLDFCHSVKYEYWTTLFADFTSAFSKLPCARREHSYYLRKRDLPQVTSGIEVGFPSTPQVITGGALAEVRRQPSKWTPPALFALPDVGSHGENP